MLLLSTSSGLTGLPADLVEFLGAVEFARPAALWLLLLVPVLGVVNRWAARRRRSAVALVGRPATVSGQLTRPAARFRWLGLAYPLAWIALILGLAGPRWGKSSETGIAVGRDLVIVIDLSRSMQAPDMSDPGAPTRWQAARVAALDLLSGVARRGGHRVAVIAFAAKPRLLCPLTTDYDHVRAVIEDLDGEFPPPEIRPGPADVISGTRIGAALKAAVAAHDIRFTGYQDIVLLSDGDDPAMDREWIHGVDAARKADIPVHVVGLGNPIEDYVLTFGDELAPTHLREGDLQQIAADTRGQYIAARRDTPRLGDFFRSHIEPLPARAVSDEALPLPRERYAYLLALSLMLFLIGWIRGK